MTAKKPWAHLDPKSWRAETWREIYGGLAVPIESPAPIVANSPVGIRRFYKVDISRLEPHYLERVIAHVAEVFGYPADEVRTSVLGDDGLPILADDVTVTFDPRMVT